jgi:hypothetical protein
VDNLRQLIDLCGREALPGLLCLYAVPPEFLSRVVPEYVALQQRLESPATLSRRSPQSVVIDLESLDLPQAELLTRIGERIFTVFEEATGAGLTREVQLHNLGLLAQAVLERAWDVAHRRTYVKAAVALLYDQRAAGEREMAPEDVTGLASQAATVEPQADDFEEF